MSKCTAPKPLTGNEQYHAQGALKRLNDAAKAAFKAAGESDREWLLSELRTVRQIAASLAEAVGED